MAKDLSGLLGKMDLLAHALPGGPRSPENQAERPPQVLSVLFAFCLREPLAHTSQQEPKALPCPGDLLGLEEEDAGGDGSEEVLDGGRRGVQVMLRMAEKLERMERLMELRNAQEDAKRDGISVHRLAGGEKGVE